MRLHHKHGLNPTMPVCFWCEKETGEIVLLGAAYDGEAHRHMTLNYDPCPTCKTNFEKGITLIEANTKTHDRRPPIQTTPVTLYPTGRFVVITEEAAIKLFTDSPMFGEIMRKRMAFVEPALFDALMSKEKTE